MSLAGQWRSLETGLPRDWRTASLRLDLSDPKDADRASALLGPAQPFRLAPDALRFSTARDGTAVGAEAVNRLLTRIDEAKIDGTLRFLDVEQQQARAARPVAALAKAWDRALAGLPSDWSDLLCELTLDSSDYVEPAAVLCIQMNPRRVGDTTVFRFRCARTAGYGVEPNMARRCLERCDEQGIVGTVAVLRLLSDTHLVATQGPVWQLDGNTV